MANSGTSGLSVIALVLAIIALVLAIVLSMRLKGGPQVLHGIEGPKGALGNLVWGKPIEYGPYTLDIGTAGDYFSITVNPSDRVRFTVIVSDSDVYYWVVDP